MLMTAMSRQRSRIVLVCAAAAMLWLPAAAAQVVLTPDGPVDPKAKPPGAPAKRGPEVFQREVDPAPESRPALRYRLVTEYGDETPGNAVPYYYRALVQFLDGRRELMKQYYDNEQTWLEGPIQDLPRDDVRKFLDQFSSIFDQLAVASRRETVDWDWRMRDLRGVEPISFLLAEIQEARSLARLLRLKARLEIAEGRYEDALDTLRTGYALARAVAEPPTLINALVGVAISSIMHAELRELIAAPDSPNLYWALSELPRPLIDMRQAFRYEMSIPEQMFPFLKDAETAERSPAEWQSVVRQSFERIGEVQGLVSSSDEWGKAGLGFMAAGLVIKGYPHAKRDLIEAGYDAERVDQMPVAQVVAIHQSRVYRYMYQEMFKWTLLPYTEARQRRNAAEDRLKAEGYFGPAGTTREIIPIASLLLPAVFQAAEAEIRLETRTAGLRALEAARMHAAVNGGAWPKELEEVTVVPVPNNPRDGQPFPYRVEGDKAILEIPGPEGQEVVGWRFELTLRKRQEDVRQE
jgi:hypothetical protein